MSKNRYIGNDRRMVHDESNHELLKDINHRFDSLEQAIATKQNKMPASVFSTLMLFLIVQTGSFLYYGGQVVLKVNDATEFRYNSLTAAQDKALYLEKFNQFSIRLSKEEAMGKENRSYIIELLREVKVNEFDKH